ncbi:cytochrome c oxidase assembly protein [Micromonospora sp. WMMD987]|uniref:cytochrome c oxidase assembly protein n=1 Tax=Micromonospora sp. WMMD987 TaxID=3016089 RepID=UPI00249AE52E|nr:cytochrome c oxidase assembly protein [Micromonospora sp. WMMD987]WFE93657.1 cytochrome c oxidase assembly protein [Micromonospora sp. WMMD987]
MTGPHGGVDPLLLVPMVLFWGYLAAALRQRDPGRAGWSHWRTASFGVGTALLAVALLLPAHDLVGHVWQHLLVGMLAPLGLVLGAPGTLALRTVRPRVGRAALRLLRRRVAAVALHPVTGLLLTAGGLYLLHLTPLYRATLAHPGLHTLVLLHFLASGYVFSWAIAGPDPGPHRPGVPLRLAVLGLSVAAHATLAQLMYAGLVDVAAPADRLRTAATLMYYVGDLAEILLALALLATWRPTPRRDRPTPDRPDRRPRAVVRT